MERATRSTTTPELHQEQAEQPLCSYCHELSAMRGLLQQICKPCAEEKYQ